MKIFLLSMAGISTLTFNHWGPFGMIVMLFFILLFLEVWHKEIIENTTWYFDLDKYFKSQNMKAWQADLNHWAFDVEGQNLLEIEMIKNYKNARGWCIEIRR